MRIAALTYVYNERHNLKIWLDYYGKNFGTENLYFVDRQSDDGSTSNVGMANKIVVPRTDFDDIQKAVVLSSIHTALLQSFDCVVVTDCDEIVVADPSCYKSLFDYIERNRPTVMNCIGLNLYHIITRELPIELNRPILSQRQCASFEKFASKPLISSVPTKWEAGGHICTAPPRFDEHLFMFHLKFMDYSLAMSRQRINASTLWSVRSIEAQHGAHHRYETERFVNEGFLDPANAVRTGLVRAFEFSEEIKIMAGDAVQRHGFFHLGDAKRKWVEIPDRFGDVF